MWLTIPQVHTNHVTSHVTCLLCILAITNPGWNSFANVLYVDQPAGTGFSYVTNPLGYVTNERTIGVELWTMIQEFYKKYPKYASLDLYLVGESYGELSLLHKVELVA